MGIEQSGSPAVPRLDIGEALLEYTLLPDEFIGTRAFASARSDTKKGEFNKITRESILRRGTKVKRAPNAAYERDGYETEPQSYACQERGHENGLDQSIINLYADDFDAEMHAAKLEMRKVALDQEIDIAAIVFDGTTTFTVANGLRTDTAVAWSAAATATPLKDVTEAKESISSRTGEEANTLILGRTEYKNLLLTNEVKLLFDGIKVSTLEERRRVLAEYLELEQILVGKAPYNSAKKGQAYSGTQVWGSGWASVAVCAKPGEPLNRPCIGRSVFWITDAPEGVLVEEYFEPQTRTKVIRARSHADELLIDANYAQLLDVAG